MSTATESVTLEREYVALRREVMRMVRSRFGTAVDAEEIYQDAWAELLELQAEGYAIEDLRKLLRTIAWRRARDRYRERRPQPVDPTSRAITDRDDSAPLPDEAAQVHLDAGTVWVIVESLDSRQAEVVKLRYGEHLELRQIRARLGITTKALDRLLARAYHTIADQLALAADGESDWERRQRSLLLLCLLGRASPRQRARARRMVEQDVHCRAMLRELRATMDQVAAALPLPVVVDETRSRHGAVLFDRIHDVLGTAKRHLADALSRTGGGMPTGEKAAAGGTAALGAGAAAKIAVGCLVAGTAAVCIAPALLPTSHPNHAHRNHAAAATPKPKPKPVHRHRKHPKPTTPAAPKRITASAPAKAKSHTHATTTTAHTSRSVSAPPAPSPAPSGGTEFGPGPIGSAPASQTPAAAPSNGGGEFTP